MTRLISELLPLAACAPHNAQLHKALLYIFFFRENWKQSRFAQQFRVMMTLAQFLLSPSHTNIYTSYIKITTWKRHVFFGLSENDHQHRQCAEKCQFRPQKAAIYHGNALGMKKWCNEYHVAAAAALGKWKCASVFPQTTCQKYTITGP